MNPLWFSFAGAEIEPGDRKFVLLHEVWEAQKRSCLENSGNASNMAVRNSAAASMSLVNSIASAMLSTGGLHAPVIQARRVIFNTHPSFDPTHIVPGFGNSFYKDKVDPAWDNVLEIIECSFEREASKIQSWSEILKENGKVLYPNAACLTAAAAEIVEWPHGLEPLLVVEPRIAMWAHIYLDSIPAKKLIP